MPSDAPSELVDIVDENDVVLQSVTREQMRREKLRHRVAFVLVRRSDSRVLIHRRSDDKDLWPGWWDIAIGGVVASGESYDDAAARELNEEAGIDVVPRFVSTGTYEDDDVALVAHCYEVLHDGPVENRDGEVAEFEWVTIVELETLVSTRRFLPDSLYLLGSRLFGAET